MGIRMTWQYTDDGVLLRNIGEHDKTFKNPLTTVLSWIWGFFWVYHAQTNPKNSSFAQR